MDNLILVIYYGFIHVMPDCVLAKVSHSFLDYLSSPGWGVQIASLWLETLSSTALHSKMQRLVANWSVLLETLTTSKLFTHLYKKVKSLDCPLLWILQGHTKEIHSTWVNILKTNAEKELLLQREVLINYSSECRQIHH